MDENYEDALICYSDFSRHDLIELVFSVQAENGVNGALGRHESIIKCFIHILADLLCTHTGPD